MKNKMTLIIVVMLILFSVSFLVISEESSQSMMFYKTLKGTLHSEGTDKVNTLIFQDENDKKYLISGDKKETLSKLVGVPLILTGKVKEITGEFVRRKIKVEMYNTFYDKYIFSFKKDSLEDVSILGLLKKSSNNLVLITPDQQVIRIDPETYHSLAQYEGKKVLINGDLEKLDDYKARMKMKSYRVIEK